MTTNYSTLDGYFNLTEDDFWWIPAIDTDSFDYWPKQVLIKRSIAGNELEGYYKEKNCQIECDRLNSL